MSNDMLVATTPNGTFPVFVESPTPGLWCASCMYSDDKRMLKAPGEDRDYTLRLHREPGDTKEAALAALSTWLKSHFGADIPIREATQPRDHLFRLLFASVDPTINFSSTG